MVTTVTNGIKVSVETAYRHDHSKPADQHYVFTYRITIENNSNSTVQLKARHWDIKDAAHPSHEVDGDGVVGKQPVLEPGQMHQYVSGCNLKSGIGKMSGHYVMEQILNGSVFHVEIPEFMMVVPFKLN
ncbi:MAG: Co2+/Mg2+ efflux protein ApaG [Bacteroidota bacterium]